MHTDEHLNVWGDRFMQSALSDCMRFDQFMEMSPALREREMSLAEQSEQQAIQRKLEAEVPGLVLRGDHLIEPLHHTVSSAGDRPVGHILYRAMK